MRNKKLKNEKFNYITLFFMYLKDQHRYILIFTQILKPLHPK